MLLAFLNKPLPGAQFNVKSVLKYLCIGLFVGLFLIVFQPFDTNEWKTDNKALKLLGFGFVSFLAPTLYNFLLVVFLPKRFLEDKWTVGKEILSILIVLMLIALGNMLYSNAISIMQISFLNFTNALIPVILLGIFPVTFLVLSKHNRLLKRNVAEASIINNQLQTEKEEIKREAFTLEPKETKMVLVAENEKDKLELPAEELLYIESADNYSNVVYTANGQLKRQLIRSSLKRLESQLQHPHILRCHRTYIVNLKQVNHIDGNAAGYKLSVGQNGDILPVSRNFGPVIIAALKSLK